MKNTKTVKDKNFISYIPMTADLFHIGHLRALQKAMNKSFFLYVGLLSDEAINNYKGCMPVIPYAERKAIIEAVLRYSDVVVKQDSLDMTKYLKKYKVDTVWSGDGFEKDELKAIKECGARAGKFNYYKGQSTTKIKNKIIKLYEKSTNR